MKSKVVSYTHETLPRLTAADRETLAALADMPDDTIDFSDIPELTDEQMKTAVRGRFTGR